MKRNRTNQCFYCGSRRASRQVDSDTTQWNSNDMNTIYFCFGYHAVCDTCLESHSSPSSVYLCNNNECNKRLCGNCINRKICCHCWGDRKNSKNNQDSDDY